jgi:CsoR family transcriptional regulator, copper-sensing transcriptional repressor
MPEVYQPVQAKFFFPSQIQSTPAAQTPGVSAHLTPHRGGGYTGFTVNIQTQKSRANSSTSAPRDSGSSAANCACETKSGAKKAAGVDPDLKIANRKRLRRIEGQVRGLQRMLEDDRYCPDIIVQVASVQEALRGVARNLMRNHLKHCAAQVLRSGDKKKSEEMYDELLETIYTHLR